MGNEDSPRLSKRRCLCCLCLPKRFPFPDYSPCDWLWFFLTSGQQTWRQFYCHMVIWLNFLSAWSCPNRQHSETHCFHTWKFFWCLVCFAFPGETTRLWQWAFRCRLRTSGLFRAFFSCNIENADLTRAAGKRYNQQTDAWYDIQVKQTF